MESLNSSTFVESITGEGGWVPFASPVLLRPGAYLALGPDGLIAWDPLTNFPARQSERSYYQCVTINPNGGVMTVATTGQPPMLSRHDAALSSSSPVRNQQIEILDRYRTSRLRLAYTAFVDQGEIKGVTQQTCALGGITTTMVATVATRGILAIRCNKGEFEVGDRIVLDVFGGHGTKDGDFPTSLKIQSLERAYAWDFAHVRLV